MDCVTGRFTITSYGHSIKDIYPVIDNIFWIAMISWTVRICLLSTGSPVCIYCTETLTSSAVFFQESLLKRPLLQMYRYSWPLSCVIA